MRGSFKVPELLQRVNQHMEGKNKGKQFREIVLLQQERTELQNWTMRILWIGIANSKFYLNVQKVEGWLGEKHEKVVTEKKKGAVWSI